MSNGGVCGPARVEEGQGEEVEREEERRKEW